MVRTDPRRQATGRGSADGMGEPQSHNQVEQSSPGAGTGCAIKQAGMIVMTSPATPRPTRYSSATAEISAALVTARLIA
jgi:hypothetical protein